MPHSEYRFKSETDGLQVQAYSWLPEEAPIASLQITHGLAEHSLRYARFAKRLNTHGVAVLAHDHRGHGRSILGGGKIGEVGEAGWGGLVADLVQHNQLVNAQYPGIPNFLFGHSMGSFAVQQFLLDHSSRIDGAVLSGSTDIALVAQLVAETGEAPSFATYNEAFAPNRTDFDWLSRDEREVDTYVADPLCGFDVEERLMAGLIEAASRLGDPEALKGINPDLPLLVMAGDADPLNAGLALLHSLVGKYQAAGLNRMDTKFYPGGRHEMLNETNRDEVETDIIAWLQANV